MNRYIEISSLGLMSLGKGRKLCVAHKLGNWGPESEGSDHSENPLGLSNDGKIFACLNSFLREGEEFKIVISGISKTKARSIYVERVRAGVHVGTRFDYDEKQKAFWLLAEKLSGRDCPVVRPGRWNQNNVNFHI